MLMYSISKINIKCLKGIITVKLINHLPQLVTEVEAKIGKRVQQNNIATDSGVPEGTLSRYLNGRIGSVKLEIEYKLCVYFSEKLGRQIRRDDVFSFDFDADEAD